MKPSIIPVVLSVAATMMSVPSHADDPRKAAGDSHRIDSGMQAVSTDATIGQPGYGRHYFVDARKGRAVAISPSGDSFYSHGKAPTLVFKANRHRLTFHREGVPRQAGARLPCQTLTAKGGRADLLNCYRSWPIV